MITYVSKGYRIRPHACIKKNPFLSYVHELNSSLGMLGLTVDYSSQYAEKAAAK